MESRKTLSTNSPWIFHFGITFLSLLHINLVCCDKIKDLDIARQFLAAHNERAMQIYFTAALAKWDYNTNLTDYNQNRATVESVKRSLFLKEAAKNTSLFDWENFEDYDVKRQFKKLAIIGTAKLPEEKIEKVDTLKSQMTRIYSTGEICGKPGHSDQSECFKLDPGLTRLMAEERDWDVLEWAWKGWREVTGRKMPEIYEEYISLLNEGATLNGFADTGEYWRSWYEDAGFEEDIGEMWETVKPLYQQLHAYVHNILKKHYKEKADRFPDSGHIPAHLFGNMWSQEWNNVLELAMPYPNSSSIDITPQLVEEGYDAEKMFEVAEEFFTSLGLIEMPESFWRNSMIVRPEDGRDVVCHASAWDFYNQRDFRIKQCTDITKQWLTTTHHEMGHIQYYLQYKDLPVVYRRGANPGFHEAVGDVLALSVATPEHLKEIGLLTEATTDYEADINFLLSQALKKIAFLPFGYLIDQWRWSVFRGDTKPEDYNQKWWELRCKHQGIFPPVGRASDDFDPGAKFHIPNNTPYIRYFVSFILQFQFHKSLCETAGQAGPLHRCDIYRSTAAGTKLSNMLKLGSSRPWPDALEALSGTRKMSADALLEYFRPLQEWLTEENEKNGVKIGWEDACPPETFSGSPKGSVTSVTLLITVALWHFLCRETN